MALTDPDWMCPLCRERLQAPATAPCGHTFCDDCIRRHLTSNDWSTCPVCQNPLSLEDVRAAPPVAAHSPTAPAASAAHSPNVSFCPPPDGPPPYSSTPTIAREVEARETLSRVEHLNEAASLLRETIGLTSANAAEEQRKKIYRSLKKLIYGFSVIVLCLFVVILLLLVWQLASKQNPVCNLSTPHSEALTVNILGEIQYAREQAKSDHRDLQNRLTDIYSKHSSAITGILSKEIIEAKDNITTDFLKLERKFNQILNKVTELQQSIGLARNASTLYGFAPTRLDLIFISVMIYLLW